MPPSTSIPATDSANELRPILGDDATATFEDDPNFVNSNPAENGSSENVEEQRSAAASYSAATHKATDDEEDEDEDEDLDDEDDEDDEDIDEEDDDGDDFDDDDEDEDEDEDEDDDADGLNASSVFRAGGLLGDEDESDDVRNGVNRKTGDRERAKVEEELNDGEKSFDPYSSEDGKWLPVERDDVPEQQGALIRDKNANPDFVPPYREAAFAISASL